MKLGVQFPNESEGTKYPFSEDSALVSAQPVSCFVGSGPWNVVPCDLFDDVCVDVSGGVSVFLQSLDGMSGKALFAVSDAESGEVLASFELGNRDFDELGRAFYASNAAFVRVSTKYARSFGNLLGKIAGTGTLSGRIDFDPRCLRVAEKRLEAFDVGGIRVSGDVVFEPGYNVSVARPDYVSSNNVSVSAVSGAGAGRVPCDVAYPESSGNPGILGVSPDKDGGVRIESDGCYSVVPFSDKDIQILHHCGQCCSCEGDYLPAANAVNHLAERLDAIYDELCNINRDYNAKIAEVIDGLSAAGDVSLSVRASKTESQTAGKYDIQVAMSFVDVVSGSVCVLGADFTVGPARVSLFDLASASDIVPETRPVEVEAALAVRGVVEVYRSLQVGSKSKTGPDATIPPGEHVLLQSGSEMHIRSNSKCFADSWQSQGPYVASESGYTATVRYCLESDLEAALEEIAAGGECPHVVSKVFEGVFS